MKKIIILMLLLSINAQAGKLIVKNGKVTVPKKEFVDIVIGSYIHGCLDREQMALNKPKDAEDVCRFEAKKMKEALIKGLK